MPYQIYYYRYNWITVKMSYHSGDDIGAVVCDPGSYYLKVGFAGDDYPRSYKSSVNKVV
jgi:hypothetical protein